ncbi:tetratricopeptide repeat protein [Pyxidicoccus sp. MSG2]|uniref:tetratricopeptide repeat protein n=1 Tax=Pyxidicoccus sp. MSG2 TaxID=2996790 RepID=UPI0022716CAC|nr:tetratricopeptide repeat protein [Pyxidicoccus sp. MSG2]MCY1019705.1 tetratricopeptide repeat protein [Pyxidicoccus sp. MSG2]
MPHRSLRPLLLLASLLIGCSSGLRVNVLEPARVNVGASRKLVVVQTEGQSTVQDVVLQELYRQSRQDGYFSFTDRTHAGGTVKLTGSEVLLQGEKATALESGEVGLRIDVLGWDADLEKRQLQVKDEKGRMPKKTQKQVFVAKLILGVTAFNSAGKVLLAEEEYAGEVESERVDVLLRTVAGQLVDRVLRDLTPRQVSHYLRMDDEDAAQKDIVKVAEKGDVGQAITQLTSYVEQHPDNAGGWYNLAVLLDASGEYEKALEHYSRAISLTSKDFYVKMQEACSSRLASRQALRE